MPGRGNRFTAQNLYGAPPLDVGQGPGSGKIVGGGDPVPAPDATVTALPLTGVLDDPAFWLVAILGVGVYLAIASN